MNIIYLLLAFLFFGYTSCNKSKISQLKEEAISSNTLQDKNPNKKAKILNKSNFNIDSVKLYYPESTVTSGRTNKPDLFKGCNLKQNKNFGFYDIIDQKSKSKPPIIAKVIVSFENIPWHYSDTNQEVLALIVKDRLFRSNPFSFSVGDSISRVTPQFNKISTIDDIHYYNNDNCTLAIKQHSEIIAQYIIYWSCTSSHFNIKEQNSAVESYFK